MKDNKFISRRQVQAAINVIKHETDVSNVAVTLRYCNVDTLMCMRRMRTSFRRRVFAGFSQTAVALAYYTIIFQRLTYYRKVTKLHGSDPYTLAVT